MIRAPQPFHDRSGLVVYTEMAITHNTASSLSLAASPSLFAALLVSSLLLVVSSLLSALFLGGALLLFRAFLELGGCNSASAGLISLLDSPVFGRDTAFLTQKCANDLQSHHRSAQMTAVLSRHRLPLLLSQGQSPRNHSAIVFLHSPLSPIPSLSMPINPDTQSPSQSPFRQVAGPRTHSAPTHRRLVCPHCLHWNPVSYLASPPQAR